MTVDQWASDITE